MTKEFKIDGFDALGNKKASVKIDVFKRRISYMVSSHTFSYSFEELSEMVNDESFFWLCRELGYDIVRLQEMIERVVYSEKLIVEMWYEALQREYYLRHSYKLSPLHTSWRELIKKGYKGGGVAVILLDQNERVLCYQIPEGITSKAAGRSAGQWNIFIETAEPIQPDQDGNTLEPFATNLQRAFSEEIGIPLPRATMQYFETDYEHKKIRARCAIFSVSAETIDEITKGSRTHAHEIGQTK